MLPYIASTTYSVFGLRLQTWGTLVAAGFGLGTYVAYRRAQRTGLDPDTLLDLAFWIFVGAFVGARVFHVLLYQPTYYWSHPLEALDPRQPGWAMFGGLIGAAAVFLWIARRRRLDLLAYADTLVWGLPWGCGVGRIGCFLIHDHPGTLSNFVLAVKYPDGRGRHDLGLYLSLAGFLTGMLFLILNRQRRHPGFWLGAYMLIEGLVRFTTDFLRVADQTYFGLTPTQYLALPLFFAGAWLVQAGQRGKKHYA